MIIKSKPRVIPNKRANVILILGKIANKLTIIQNMDHKITVVNEFLFFMYLSTNHKMAITDIIGNNKEYNNILSPFKIDV